MTFLRHADPVALKLEGLGIAKAAASRLSRSGTLLDLAAGTTVGPGAVVGEVATLDPHRTRNATVVAHTPLVVLVFDVRTFRSIAQDEDLRDRLAPLRTAA
jgi:CRP-like cAMP-binding protein